MTATIARSTSPHIRRYARPAATPPPARNALLQNAIETMDEGVSVFDRKGRLVFWNTRFVELLELPGELEDGITLKELLWGQAMRGDFGAVELEEAVLKRAVAFFRDVPTVQERTTPSGRILQIRRRAMPDGGVISLYVDITERRATEGRMAQARAEAELASRSKSEFLANMSHELRTPLNAIIGFSELICEGILGPVVDDRVLAYIRDIQSSGLHLLEIVNDVLDMSKIEAGKLELAFEWVAVHQVIADVLSMVDELARSRRLDIAVTVEPADILAFADKRAIKQMVLNLLSNAIKFSTEGGRIAIRAGRSADGGLVLEVEDHGIGMTDDEMTRAVQPFVQAKPNTTSTYGGTGLGLPIVKGLADAHGGNLAIDSTPGRGTVVRILLPVQPGAPLPDAVAERPVPTGLPAPSAEPFPAR